MKKQWEYAPRFHDQNDGLLTEEEKAGGEDSLPTVEVTRRFYHEGPSTWPRLVISIVTNVKWMQKTQGIGFIILVNRKDGIENWWTNSHIPTELLPHLAEMIEEFKQLLQKSDEYKPAASGSSPG